MFFERFDFAGVSEGIIQQVLKYLLVLVDVESGGTH
jgi:hypothetical protein